MNHVVNPATVTYKDLFICVSEEKKRVDLKAFRHDKRT